MGLLAGALPAVACASGLGLLGGGLYRLRRRRRGGVALLPTTKEKTDLLWSRLSKGRQDAPVTKTDAAEFFGEKFGKLSVDCMFSQVINDKKESMTKVDWDSFWEHVKFCGYGDPQISEEVDNMVRGQAWVDWKDGRKPGQPKRASRTAGNGA
mmetsp:Transcript_41698/g.94120  ORF Transcript_41698/g.94120 Transcript_41698/m.94120 type:complete len:153 (-) Transcript_41698:129-587(-)